MRTAVLFVALPGTGKTAIGAQLARELPNTKRIEQDDHYTGRAADHRAYLGAIRRGIRRHNLVLCKNHHTVAQRAEVLAALRGRARVLVVNLVPRGLAALAREERDAHLDRLLDRIAGRGDGSSHLVIDGAHSRARARAILKHAFWRAFEEPTEPALGAVLHLDYTASAAANAATIRRALAERDSRQVLARGDT